MLLCVDCWRMQIDLLPSPARGMKRLWRRTTPLQSTCTLRPWASILCLQTVLLQGYKSCCLRFQWIGWNPLFSEHMPTSSLISLNKPKKMPTRFEQVMIIYIKGDVFRAFKFYEIGIPAQAPWQKPSFDLGLHPSISEGSGDNFNVHIKQIFGTI